MTTKYIFNPEYILLPDKDRVQLRNRNGNANNSYCVFLHPVHALLFSVFDGKKQYIECLEEIQSMFGVTSEAADSIISPFIENSKQIPFKYDGQYFIVPENIIIENRENTTRNDICTESLMIKPPYDFKTRRLRIPRRILFVINTICVTDCIYCYADRKTRYKPLSTGQILSIIDEAIKMGVTELDFSGGEILLQKNWNQIISKLISVGITPYISTKKPLDREEVRLLKVTGVKTIQISLDSLNSELLSKTLGVKNDYADRIKKTITYLDESEINIILKSTVTKDTCTEKNIKELIDFAITIPHVIKYTFTPTGYSHYKSVEHFNEIKPTLGQAIKVKAFLEELQSKLPFDVKLDDSTLTNGDYICNTKAFSKRGLCTGNVDAMIILPDGKVTICEELYWDPNFIIGDLTKSLIMDVWESDRAVNLWKLSQNDIPEASACKHCDTFNDCRFDRGVCWKEIIAVYGRNNWLFPDPKCPKAPTPHFSVFYDNSFLE